MDRLPDDYGSQCTWGCKNWAWAGKCDEVWVNLDNRCSSANKKVKDTCKVSCDTCGKHPT